MRSRSRSLPRPAHGAALLDHRPIIRGVGRPDADDEIAVGPVTKSLAVDTHTATSTPRSWAASYRARGCTLFLYYRNLNSKVTCSLPFEPDKELFPLDSIGKFQGYLRMHLIPFHVKIIAS